jgi:hypothetical protein
MWMRVSDIIREAEEYQPPKIKKGDEIKTGKFKNKKAEVTGFDVDDHGQPVLQTTKGDQKLFKPRISKLEPKKMTERTEDEIADDEISLVIMSVQNLISKYRRSQNKAADIYHDVMMTGQLITWMEENFVPIWEKHGYPPIGQPAWGEVELEFMRNFLWDQRYR